MVMPPVMAAPVGKTSSADQPAVATSGSTDFSAAKRKRRSGGGNAAGIRSFMGVAGMIIGIAAAQRAQRQQYYVYDGGYVGEPYQEYAPAPAYEYAPGYEYEPAYQYQYAPNYQYVPGAIYHRPHLPRPHVHHHGHGRQLGHVARIGARPVHVGGRAPNVRSVGRGGGRRR